MKRDGVFHRRSMSAIAVTLLLFTGSLLAETTRSIKDDHRFGCTSREQFDKLSKYAVDGDLEAFKQALMVGILTKECTMFKKDERVYVVETKIFSGLVKVRRQGKVKEYWANIEALKK